MDNTMRAYRVTDVKDDDLTLIYPGDTPGEAKAAAHFDSGDAGYRIPFTNFRARREPRFDEEASKAKRRQCLGWAWDEDSFGVLSYGRHYTYEA